MTTVYIAGPMRGIRHFNFPAFDAARDRLKGDGWKPISPADLDRAIGFDEKAFPDDYDWRDLGEIGFNLSDAVSRDVEQIQRCNAIFMLNGWEKSKGATAEKAIAEWLGLEVMYEATYGVRRSVAADTGKVKDVTLTISEGKTIVNEKGGKQSYIAARFDCLPPECQRLLAQCLGFGARRYGKDNWRNIDLDDNIAHCLNHLNEFRRGDKSEPHLVNALARLNFALAIAVSEGIQAPDYVHPEMSNV
jgi:hypothetical protein